MITNFLLSLSLLFASHPVSTAVPLDQISQLLNQSVLIRIKQYKVDNITHEIQKGMAGCSGTFVTATTVLTAGHCFANPSTEIWVRDGKTNESFVAHLKKLDYKADLALLSVDIKKPHVYAVLSSTVTQGEDVTAVGSPLGLEFLLSQGIVSKLGFQLEKDGGHLLLHTAMINSGSSGGGLFNSKGQLIGVNTLTIGGFFGWAGISGAVDLATINTFLTPVKNPRFIIEIH